MTNRHSISDAAGKRLLAKLKTEATSGYITYRRIEAALDAENVVGTDRVGLLVTYLQHQKSDAAHVMLACIGRAATWEAAKLRQAVRAYAHAQEALKDFTDIAKETV